MMNKVRFGIIGCGVIASFHAQAISQLDRAELVGAYDSYAPGLEAFAQKQGITAYPTLEALLAAPEIDAVCICTPSGLHTPQAVQAMRAGKHIVCEKPMSLTLQQADELIAAEQETGAKVCIISQFRFTEATREVKRAMDEGALGKLTHASLYMKYYRSQAYYDSGAWRGTWAMDGGGALMNQGIHGVDVFRYLVGPVRSLYALTRTQIHDIEVEDCAAAVLELENGALGTIEGSTSCYPGYPRRIELCGDKGSVVMEEDSILHWDLPIPCRLPVGKAASNVAASDPKAISCAGHVYQIGNLVRAILDGEPLIADAKSGRLPLEIILGIYESNRTGKAVRLDQ